MSGLMVRVGSLITNAKHVRFTSSLRGAEKASFAVDKFFRHPDLKAGAEVRITHNGRIIWPGRISEPNDGDTFHCVGIAAFGDQVAAIDSGAGATRKPFTAVGAAFTRGAVPWLMHTTGTVPGGDISDVAWAPDDKDTSPLSLSSLLSGWATDSGLRWRIDGGNYILVGDAMIWGQGHVVTWADPTTPKWRIEQPGITFTQAADNSPTHLLVQYLAGVGDFQVHTVDLGAGAATRREEIVDVTDRGFITQSAAETLARNKFAIVGGRLAGLAETLIIGRGSVATMGGIVVDPLALKPGDMARAFGQPKDSLLTKGLPHLDIIIDGYEFDADTWTAALTPVGGQRRDFVSVLSHAASTPTAGQAPTVAVSPTTHDSASLGPSGNFNNTAQAAWAGAAATIVPTRDGWATITAELDTQDNAAGYGLARVWIRADGTVVDGMIIRFEGVRLSTRFTARVPVRVRDGTNLALAMDVACFSAAGSWKINSLTWRVTVE